ncbi:hypothetical protein RFI_26078 [Reticulomyxa filosa]|uniref:Uncharacterized protein n=1 Tax=Reticulomyxa filosa TaxID=46433 RepID=X6MCX5_RETFI|nr:hypothetical protein RFI_26078 [Reticulomyxa filosa]|eukprot:ETO11302.1 hypothetical protein RFI_26078 [Reticulomyxa filosa]
MEKLKEEVKELESIRKSRKRVGCTCKPINKLSIGELRKILGIIHIYICRNSIKHFAMCLLLARYSLPANGNLKALQERVKNHVLQSSNPLLARFREPSSSPCYSPQNTYRFGQPLEKLLVNKNKTQNKKKKLNLLNQCCWDDTCECVRSGIRCHDSGPCGCLDNNTPCDNPNGQYIFKEPHYPKKILQEWLQEYNDVPSDNDNNTETSCSSSYLRTSSDNEEEIQENNIQNLPEKLSTFMLA